MFDQARSIYATALQEIRDAGLDKQERTITSPQGPEIVTRGRTVLNFCANNYLGLSSHPKVLEAAKAAIDHRGYGMSSVRFICGTQDVHKALEQRISDFFRTEDTILYSSCFDANGGLFETILTDRDAIISDSLNHASIIDGIRLCKAERHRYTSCDMRDLEELLQQTQNMRLRLIATDGVFSMDGCLAPLDLICTLAEKYQAMVMVDDSHAAGVVGGGGRGTPEYFNVQHRVDIITGTLGKALGGASGGYVTGRKEIIALLRERSRPYLFSNTLAPSIAATSLIIFDLLENECADLLKRVMSNARRFRDGMSNAGFNIKPGFHPIVPVMLGDARLAAQMASDLLQHGIYVLAFFYPVVPQGQARIRVQLSAAHTEEHVDQAIAAFTTVGRKLGVIEG